MCLLIAQGVYPLPVLMVSLFRDVSGHQSWVLRVFCAASGSIIWPIRLCIPVSKYRGGRNMNMALSKALVLRNSLWCNAILFPIKPWISSSLLKLVSEHQLFIPKKRLNQIVFQCVLPFTGIQGGLCFFFFFPFFLSLFASYHSIFFLIAFFFYYSILLNIDVIGQNPCLCSSSRPFALLIVYRSQKNRSDFFNEFYVLASDLVTGHLYLSFVRPLI